MDSGRLIKCSLVVAFFAACLCACTDEQAIQLDVESFSVRVVDKGSGEPVEGALVLAIYPSGSGGHAHVDSLVRIEEAMTNDSGYVTFPSWSENSERLFMEGSPRVVVAKLQYRANVHSTASKVSSVGRSYIIKDIFAGVDGVVEISQCPSGRAGEECYWLSKGRILTAVGPVTSEQESRLPNFSDLVEKYASHFRL